MFSKITQFAEAQREIAEAIGHGVKDFMNKISDLFDIDFSSMYGLDTIKHKNPTEAKTPANKEEAGSSPAKSKITSNTGKSRCWKAITEKTGFKNGRKHRVRNK